METEVIELLSKDLKYNFSDKELQELLNQTCEIKNVFISLCNKKNQDEV